MKDKDEPVILKKNSIIFADDAHGFERFFKLEHWCVKTADREDDRIVWIRGEFVLIVAVTPEQKVVVLREYKQAAGTVLLGLPAGAKKNDETPKAAALRELREESGYSATEDHCSVFGPFLNSPDKSTEKHYVVFVSDVVKFDSPSPDESETILEVKLLDLESAKREIKIGMHRMALQEVHDLLADQKTGMT